MLTSAGILQFDRSTQDFRQVEEVYRRTVHLAKSLRMHTRINYLVLYFLPSIVIT